MIIDNLIQLISNAKKIPSLLSMVVALSLVYFSPPLFADIEADILNSLDDQFNDDYDVKFIARDTILRAKPDANSEPVTTLKSDSKVYIKDKGSRWAEVTPTSNDNISGFVPISSLTRSPGKKSSAAEKNSIEIDLSGVDAKSPREIALAQSQRVEQERLQKIRIEEERRRRRQEQHRREDEREAREKREEERKQRQYDREWEAYMAESNSGDPALARQWEDLTKLPDNITQPVSPYQIERERRRALRMKERQSRRDQYQSRPNTSYSNDAYSSYSNSSPATSSNPSSVYDSSSQTSSSSSVSNTDSYAGVKDDYSSVQQKPRSPQKVYEPSPQVVTGKNLTAFHDRDKAIAYARMNGNSKIAEQCRDKGARYETTKFSEVEKGNSAVRTTFANPNCKQLKNGSWDCTAEVRGHCYRMR